MSSPGREVPAGASPPAYNDTTYLATSPSPSIASHRQRHQQQFQPHGQHQQAPASEAASSSTAALQGQDQQHQQRHYDHDLNPLGHSHSHEHDNDAPSSSDHLPPFEPIFTLLTNTTTNTTVHPRVRYLFSDDDDASAVLTAPQTDPSHRALVVDLAPPANPNGKWTVSWASSLTPDFAVTASQLSPQQHGSGSGNNDGEEGENNEGASASVMLRVEGVEREGVPADTRPTSTNLRSSSSSGGSAGGGIVGREDVDLLTEEFKRRMGVLRKVVDEGERRRETLNRLNEEVATTHPDGRDDDNTTATAAAVEDDTNAGGREPQ